MTTTNPAVALLPPFMTLTATGYVCAGTDLTGCMNLEGVYVQGLAGIAARHAATHHPGWESTPAAEVARLRADVARLIRERDRLHACWKNATRRAAAARLAHVERNRPSPEQAAAPVHLIPLPLTTTIDDTGTTVWTWVCPHCRGEVSAQTSREEWARRQIGRYAPHRSCTSKNSTGLVDTTDGIVHVDGLGYIADDVALRLAAELAAAHRAIHTPRKGGGS